jgi:hypothetical protein
MNLFVEPKMDVANLAEWQKIIQKTTFINAGFISLALSNMADSAPNLNLIKAGSRIEAGGSLYLVVSSNEAITGTPVNGAINYIYIVPNASTASAVYSTVAPTYDPGKGGFYNSSGHRAVAKFYCVSSVCYNKVILDTYNAMNHYDIYPVGSHYTQYPSADSNESATAFPERARPANIYGGSWEAKWESDRTFFRTGGSLAAEVARAAGLQADAIRNITGSLAFLSRTNSAKGALVFSSYGEAFGIGHDGNAINMHWDIFNANADPANNPMADHANGADIHPVNRLFIVWRRTA